MLYKAFEEILLKNKITQLFSNRETTLGKRKNIKNDPTRWF